MTWGGQYPPQYPQQPPQQWYPPQQPGYTGPGAPPPPPEGGTGIKLSEHMGDLVWLRVKRYDPDFVGTWGAKPAIIIDIEVIAGRSEVGKRYVDSLHTNYKLVSQLQDRIGAEFFGRIAGEASGGANPAIYLAYPSPGDEQYVQAFLSRRQGQAPGQPPSSPPPQQQQPPAQPQQWQQQQFPQNGAPNMPPPQAPPVSQGTYAQQQQGSDPPPF